MYNILQKQIRIHRMKLIYTILRKMASSGIKFLEHSKLSADCYFS